MSSSRKTIISKKGIPSISASRSSKRSSSRKEDDEEKVEIIDKNHGVFAADSYENKSEIEHVLDKPGMYIGPIKKKEREEWAYNFETKSMEKIVVDVPEALIQLYNEVIANAVDAVVSTKMEDSEARCYIDIKTDEKWIEMTNYSKSIPVVKHKKLEDEYIPTVIFSNFRSSSNYNKEKVRHGGGTNGFGVKVTNVWSKTFIVEINDPVNKKFFGQKWKNNMNIIKDPIIETSTSKVSYVRVAYFADMERFDVECYSQDVLNIFARIAIENARSADVHIKYNGVDFKPGNIRTFAKLFYGDLIKSPLVHYVWPKGTKITTNNVGIETPNDPNVLPLLEMIALNNPDKEDNTILAYANSLRNREGGLHYNTALQKLAGQFVDKVKEKTKRNKVNITYKDVEKHITIIVFVRVPDPDFPSQTKTTLETWDLEGDGLKLKDFKVPTEKFEKIVKKWDTIDMLTREVDIKDANKMAGNTDSKKKQKNIELKNGIDANNAGTKLSENCTLIITEGESAKLFGQEYGNMIYGRDNYGVQPVRGKGLNVTNASYKKLSENEEIKEINKALGLRQGMQFPRDKDQLRYGKVLIAADADVDGKHIFTLLYNFFHHFFPQLVENEDFIFLLVTPIVIAKKGKKQIKSFYYLSEYMEWKDTKEAKGWDSKYFKGLGSYKKDDFSLFKEISRELLCFSEEESWKTIRMVMDKKYADDRKQWMGESVGYKELNIDQDMITIDEFINHSFIEYCFANVVRAIPFFGDGLKVTERKIIWQMLKKWGIGFQKNDHKSVLLPINSIIKPGVQEMNKSHKTSYKVSQFASSVGEHTEYHHGEASLVGTIYSYTHDFPGSNNIPLMLPDALCGSRDKGGKDYVQPRYGYVLPNWRLLPFIFHKQDTLILEMQEEDNKEIEPKFLLTVVPLGVINGAEGIGTGWSTKCYPHDPRVVTKCMRRILNGKSPCKVPPYFNWFKGDTEIIKSKDIPSCMKETKRVVTKDERGRKVTTFEKVQNDSFDDIPDDNNAYSLVTTGVWEYIGDNDIHITELPIGLWTHTFYLKLQKMVKDKKIKDFRDSSTTEHIDIEIYDCNVDHVIKELGLCTKDGLNNMVMLDQNNIPVRYRNAVNMIEDFIDFRLPQYGDRRAKLLEIIDKNIKDLNDRIKFILAVNSGEIEIRKRPKDDIYADMDAIEVPRSLLTSVNSSHYSKEEVANLEEEIAEHQELRKYYYEKTGKDLFIIDIDNFDEAYEVYYNNKEDALDLDYKMMMKQKKKGGTSATKDRLEQLDKKKKKGKGKGKKE